VEFYTKVRNYKDAFQVPYGYKLLWLLRIVSFSMQNWMTGNTYHYQGRCYKEVSIRKVYNLKYLGVCIRPLIGKNYFI
jgi:hypothetical protein